MEMVLPAKESWKNIDYKAMRLIYVSIGNVSVLESQVLELLNFYEKNHCFNDIILLCGYKNSREKQLIQLKLRNYGFNVVWFKYFPLLPVLSYLNVVVLYIKFKQLYIEETVCHIRGVAYSFFAIKALSFLNKPISVLCDGRGLLLEEARYALLQKKASFVHRLLKKISVVEISSLYKSYFSVQKGLMSVVSPAMKEFFMTRYLLPDSFINVNPNIGSPLFEFSQSKRKEYREKYNISDDEVVVVCASGGADIWQKDYLIMATLRDKGCKVFNLSPHAVDIDGIVSLKVPFKDMPFYLAMADIAVLWRDQDIINMVASPSKFSEFAVMGLYIIHNNTVGLASDFILKSGCGILLNSVADLKEIELPQITMSQRMEWIKYAKSVFSLKVIAQNYQDIYILLNNGGTKQ